MSNLHTCMFLDVTRSSNYNIYSYVFVLFFKKQTNHKRVLSSQILVQVCGYL